MIYSIWSRSWSGEKERGRQRAGPQAYLSEEEEEGEGEEEAAWIDDHVSVSTVGREARVVEGRRTSRSLWAAELGLGVGVGVDITIEKESSS